MNLHGRVNKIHNPHLFGATAMAITCIAACSKIQTTGEPAPNEGTRSPTEEDKLYVFQVRSIEQNLRVALRDWVAKCPAPNKKKWPHDFDTDEQAAIRSAIFEYIKTNKSIDATRDKQSKETSNAAVEDLLALDDFPVAAAKESSVMNLAFREVCRNIKRSTVRTNEVVAVGREEESPSCEISRDKRAGSPSLGPPPKRPQSNAEYKPEYGEYGVECMMCYFLDATCSLGLGPPGACSECRKNGHECRLLCGDCQEIAGVAGRGVPDWDLIRGDCEDCECVA
nr:hypothetical protein CFP56_69573 [Quercus suber]